jgi:hypothetical protein
MTEQLVSFDTAKLARQKRFNIGYESYNNIGQLNDFGMSGGYYDYSDKSFEGNTWAAPTQSLLQKWLREVHKILLWVEPLAIDKWEFGINYPNGGFGDAKEYNTYEEALEIGLQEALKLIK